MSGHQPAFVLQVVLATLRWTAGVCRGCHVRSQLLAGCCFVPRRWPWNLRHVGLGGRCGSRCSGEAALLDGVTSWVCCDGGACDMTLDTLEESGFCRPVLVNCKAGPFTIRVRCRNDGLWLWPAALSRSGRKHNWRCLRLSGGCTEKKTTLAWI